MSQKALAAVLAAIGLTLLAISGVGFMILSQGTRVAESQDRAAAPLAHEPGRAGSAAALAAGPRQAPGTVVVEAADDGERETPPAYRSPARAGRD